MNAVQALKKFFCLAPRISREQAMTAFVRRYDSFRDILQANAELAAVLADMDAAQRGERPMEISWVRQKARRAILQCERMAEDLNDMAAGGYNGLTAAVAAIAGRIACELKQHGHDDINALILPLSEVNASMAYSVGGKNANLGELRNMLDMPVPRGFAVTTQAGSMLLLRTRGLFKNIYTQLRAVDPEAPSTARKASEAIEALVLEAETPPDVAAALFSAWDEAFGSDGAILAALRSSAIAEDGPQSFAGQYRSIMGVSRRRLLTAFKQVVASLFSERALAYRSMHGYPLEATGMGVCCLEMVRAKSAGVAFSRHPVDLRSNCVMINARWGLGEMVVDGVSTPDVWLVSRSTKRVTSEIITHKKSMMTLAESGAESLTHVVDVPEALRDAPCLTRDQVERIAALALELERHYQFPQDMEWAIDENDAVVLLQTRPMGIDSTAELDASTIGNLKPLFSGADVAAKGVGCGVVTPLKPGGDITHFPEGGVMLLAHSSPSVTTAMRRASAIIAETGSLTGHMASLCREFGIPTLMNVPGATSSLKAGQLVTVDAFSGRVFHGKIPELLSLASSPRQPNINTPVLCLLRRVAPHLFPLHLTDPKSALFSPENCLSLHDVMRYAHEKSYTEMFQISDSLSESSAGASSRLVCNVPLDLFVIDLGGGLQQPECRSVSPADVLSVPFRQVINGMTHPGVQAKGPRPVNIRGFLSIVGRSMIGDNQQKDVARFGERSYAIVSDRYLNFSSRIGYHYAILDTWCGDTLSKNYIRFEFAGGGAGNKQRAKRVQCIALILSKLGFTVDVGGDRTCARFRKYPKLEMLPRLDQLGRLLIMTRQMDMLMVDEESVQLYATRFLNGEYH
ncbi:MAG: pyruvate, phosphate dikinase [Desulfovibrio sp.]|jgi:pyruvate,water dikinase|nr:pyruvate, phosphate dikinase [Desulfovibrio sp.]